ncbi:MAG TPA: glycosyltransferase family 4 protein [Clostridia bacterium]|nr:glycosyltransferase family 4 protein [Clostridia bacterium]
MGVDKPVNLLMGITLSEMGGAQKVVYDLISSLPRDFYNMTLVTYPGGELIDWVKDLGSVRGADVKIIGIPEIRREISPINDLVTLIKLYKIMKGGKYDIAHFHSSKMGILGRLAAHLAGVPKIYFTVHGWGINEYQPKGLQRLFGWAEKLASKRCSMCICVSKYHRDLGLKMGWLSREKSTIIYNGIDEAPTTLGKLRNELNIHGDVAIIGTVMRLREPKQPLYTIQVFNEILSMGHRAKLVIVGDGPLHDSCVEAIESLGISDHVFMLGTRADARQLINDMDIVTLFSKWEGLPIVIIEALFAGKSVVCSGVGGVSEIIDHGIDGLILEGFDIKNGADQLSVLLQDKGLRAKIGKAAKQKAMGKFMKDRMVEDYEGVYRGNQAHR